MADKLPPHLSAAGETKTMADKVREWGQRHPWALLALLVVLAVLITLTLVAAILFLDNFFHRQFPDTVFTVAITGVTGLALPRDVVVDLPTDTDLAAGGRRRLLQQQPAPSPPAASTTAALSPVFNLTFEIDNTLNAEYDACVPGLARADVSYGGAFLAGGSVPPLCAGEYRSHRVAARASGANVAVPRFLRDQLAAELAAGDASVDVKVTMPTYCQYGSCGGAVLSCKPKIGGGTSPACRLDYL